VNLSKLFWCGRIAYRWNSLFKTTGGEVPRRGGIDLTSSNQNIEEIRNMLKESTDERRNVDIWKNKFNTLLTDTIPYTLIYPPYNQNPGEPMKPAEVARGTSVSPFAAKSLEALGQGLNGLAFACHAASVAGGWYTNLEYEGQIEKLKEHGITREEAQKGLEKLGITANKKRNIGEMLALIHSEVSEAMEGHRKNLMDDKLPHRKMLEVELADAVIRILDLSGYLNLDIGGAVVEKMQYNAKREDHKIENRSKEGGKAY
jgi:NTP pyrophosphatase (non-canonical NTP hydrolase)